MFWLRNKTKKFQFCRLDTITFGRSIKHFKGIHLFMSPKSVFVFANSENPDEMTCFGVTVVVFQCEPATHILIGFN